MPELRWTLLILGVLFVAALAWWELRRPRQAHRGDLERRTSSSAKEPATRDVDLDTPRVHREPTFSMPDIRSREPVLDLPVIEINDDSMIGLRVDGQRIDEVTPPPEQFVDEATLPSEREPEPEPARELMWETEREPEPEPEPDEVTWHTPPPLEEAPPTIEEDNVISQEFGDERPGIVPAPAPMFEARTAPIDLPPITEPIVEWPDESERRILALRLVSATDRFPGRQLRQALASEGFVLGKFSIFHQPGVDGRAVLSAASLTRPGTFDLDTMDTQRFGGLNLFAVLPGPLSALEAFDALLASARNLNERLEGGLQDERGQPLTPARILAIRETLLAQSMQPEDPSS